MTHARARRLIKRYLSASERWTGKLDSQLRAHLRECDACARHYDRAVIQHRLMLGLDTALPSGFERRRMAEAALDSVSPMPSPAPVWSLGVVAAGLAAALAFVVVRPGVDVAFDRLPEAGYMGARSGGQAELSVGIGLSGVTATGQEYEVASEHASVFMEDWLRINTSRVVDNFGYVVLVGLQEGRPPIWYYPDPEHESPQSQPVPRGTSVPLGGEDPFEFQVKKRHVVGSLTIVAYFTDQPVDLDEVQGALSERDGQLALDEIMASGALFKVEPVIRVLELRVSPGAREVDHQ